MGSGIYFHSIIMTRLMRIFKTKIQKVLITLIIFVGWQIANSAKGQGQNLGQIISPQDSILLRKFWTDFSFAVINHDNAKLAGLCNFPFYCSPCNTDTALKDNNATIKVTEKIFRQGQSKIFFEKPVKNEVEKRISFTTSIFHQAYDDNIKPKGFYFSYTIVAPSTEWEGIQGFIYLELINRQYKITGIDQIP